MTHVASVADVTLPIDAPPERSTRARNSRRARVWREQLERVAGHALATAADEVERDCVEKEHAAAVRQGPDWARIRRGATFAKPIAIKDRNALDRLLRWFALLERETWAKDKAWARHEDRTMRRTIPRSVRPVLLAVVALARKYETVFPSIERLAQMAQCCRRTAVAALDVLEYLGLVARHRRRRRERTMFGMIREVQDTSCYVLMSPPESEMAKPKPATILKTKAPVLSVQQGASCSMDGLDLIAGQVLHSDKPTEPRSLMNGPRGSHDWRSRTRALLEATVRRAVER